MNDKIHTIHHGKGVNFREYYYYNPKEFPLNEVSEERQKAILKKVKIGEYVCTQKDTERVPFVFYKRVRGKFVKIHNLKSPIRYVVVLGEDQEFDEEVGLSQPSLYPFVNLLKVGDEVEFRKGRKKESGASALRKPY